MLSGGTFHELVPRGFEANLRHRLRAAAEPRPAARRVLKRMCAEDILFYVNTFVWQYNPRCVSGAGANPYSPWAGRTEVEPFTTYPYQERVLTFGDPAGGDCYGIVRAVDAQRDHVCEKSREEGVSWLHLIVLDWLWLFHPMKALGVISRDEDAVDKADDPDSLFWKLDFMHDHLPGWLLPAGWDRKRHRRAGSFKNPENGSTIVGEASTAKAFVGGRKAAIFIDEMSQIDRAREVLGYTADVTGCRLMCGTHTGVDSAFYEVCADRQTAKTVLHWSDNPWKNRGLYEFDRDTGQIVVHDPGYAYPPGFRFVYEWRPTGGPRPGLRSPWYDAECRRRKGVLGAVARDLDINPAGAAAQFFDPAVVHDLIRRYAADPVWEGELDYDPDRGVPHRLVPKPGGLVKLWAPPTGAGRVAAGRYGAGCDISVGTGATPSCLSIFNATTGEKAAEVVTPWLAPAAFAALVAALCRLFKDGDDQPPLLAWELEGPGGQFGERVWELGYRRVYWRANEQAVHGSKRANTPGWAATPANRRLLLGAYATGLAAQVFVNRSRHALESCLHFRFVNNSVEHARRSAAGDPSGARENHGDIVIADALAAKMVRELGAAPRPEARPAVRVGSLMWRRQQYEARVRAEDDG